MDRRRHGGSGESMVILKLHKNLSCIDEQSKGQWKHTKEDEKVYLETIPYRKEAVIKTLKHRILVKTLKVQCYTECILQFHQNTIHT